jgi:hypothetical protein
LPLVDADFQARFFAPICKMSCLRYQEGRRWLSNAQLINHVMKLNSGGLWTTRPRIQASTRNGWQSTPLVWLNEWTRFNRTQRKKKMTHEDLEGSNLAQPIRGHGPQTRFLA